MVVIPPHNLDPNSGKWGTVVTKLLHQMLDGTNTAQQTAERAIKSNAAVMSAVAQTNQQITDTQVDLTDKSRIPAAPANITTATVGSWDALGNPISNITVSWDAVTADVDGGLLAVATYEIWWKPGAAVYLADVNGDPTTQIDPVAYKRLAATGSLSITAPFDRGDLFSFAVRAVSLGGTNGLFSLASDITSASSSGTILAPTKPGVSQTVGVVSVTWDGALTSGSLPSYFRYVKVLQATSSGGTYTDTGQTLSGPGGVAISGLTDGQAYYYKLQAVDSSGHASGLSVASNAITPEGVDLSALEAEIDTANQNAADALSAANTAQDVADDAQTAADQASSDAAAAAGIANSKAVVLYQTSAPAAQYRNANTLWIDTTGGANTPKRWSTGTTWVAVTDKVATDAASTAAAANSAASAAASAASAAQTTANTAITNAATADGKAVAAQTAATNAATDAATANTNAGAAQTTANTAITNAATAKTAADDAAADAATAAGIANGKGKTIFSTTAPTGADAAATTLWINTTGGANTPMRWVSGTTWAAVTDKTATDAASAAVAANAAAGTAQTTANTAVTNAATAQTAADAAQTKADTAFINAGNAQTTANGKNVVTYSTSAASSGTPGTRAGDVWFQQASGVVAGQWVWSGSAWVQQTLSNTVIASLDAGKITSGSISAARIAANTITSAMIAANTIVAGDIAAGTITATEIAANTITAAKIAAGTITANEIAAGAITTAKLDATAINGMTITGATLQTVATASRGIKIDTSGFSAYNSSGTRTVFIDPTTGALTAGAGTFTGAVNATSGTFSGSITLTGTVTSSNTSGYSAILGTYGTNPGIYFTSVASYGANLVQSPDGSGGSRTVLYQAGPTSTEAASLTLYGRALTIPGAHLHHVYNARLSASGYYGSGDEAYVGVTAGASGGGQVVLFGGSLVMMGGMKVDASNISNLPAAQITSGTLDVARIPSLDTSKITSGILPLTLGGTGVTSLSALGTSLGIVDTGWTAATFRTGYKSYDESANKCFWRIINGIVYWKGLVGLTAGGNLGTGQLEMVVLPAAARPPGSVQIVTAGQASGAFGKVYVNGTAGDSIYLLASPSTVGSYINLNGVTYPIG